MQVLDNHYLKGVNFQLNTKPMHDLKTSFEIISAVVKKTLDDQLDESANLQSYPNPSDVFDAHIITLSLLQEALSIDSEHFLWSKMQTDYAEAFPELPHLSNYNRRRKRLATSTEQLARLRGWELCRDEAAVIVDWVAVP